MCPNTGPNLIGTVRDLKNKTRYQPAQHQVVHYFFGATRKVLTRKAQTMKFLPSENPKIPRYIRSNLTQSNITFRTLLAGTFLVSTFFVAPIFQMGSARCTNY